MNVKIKAKQKPNQFEEPNIPIDKMVKADTVIGQSIVTVSGTQIIPLTSITIVNLSGGGEYGDIKTYKEADGFQQAGANGYVVTIKPKAFLVDDGKECRLLRVEEPAVEALIDKTGEFIHHLQNA
jgi:uncharacterized spore protein YtfJ